MAIDILGLGRDLGNALGIGEFAGGILLTLILLLTAISLPIYKRNNVAVLIGSIAVLSMAVALGWLPIFILIIIVLLIAVGIAERFAKLLKG